MEEDQNSVIDEVTPQDQENHEEVAPEQNDQEHVPQETEENEQDRNWRELRRKKTEYEQKIQMQDELIQQLIANRQQAIDTPVPKQEEPDEFANLAPDEYLDYGTTRKLLEREAKEIARKEYQRLRQEEESSRFRERLKSEFSDFDDVVNPETLKVFDKEHPELAKDIADLKDNYKMGKHAYYLMKSMYGTPQKKDQKQREVEEKLEKSQKSVQSPQAYDKRPMAKAFSIANMSKEEKKSLWEETLGYAGQAGFGY